MSKLLPPLCLALALVALMAGFVLLVLPPPEVDIELHRARVSGGKEHRQLLEDRLERRRWWRQAVIVGFFTSGALFAVAAFLTMEVTRGRR